MEPSGRKAGEMASAVRYLDVGCNFERIQRKSGGGALDAASSGMHALALGAARNHYIRYPLIYISLARTCFHVAQNLRACHLPAHVKKTTSHEIPLQINN